MKKLLFLLTALISSSAFAQTGWNFNEWTAQAYTSNETVDGFTVTSGCTIEAQGTSGKTIDVNGNNIRFTKRLKLNGIPTSTTKFAKFNVNGPTAITIVYTHSSGSGTNRLLNISYGTVVDEANLQSLVAQPGVYSVETVNYELDKPNTIYLASGGGGVNILGVYIAAITPDDTQALSTPRSWDFTQSLNGIDIANMTADTEKWTIDDKKYTYKPALTSDQALASFYGIELKANETPISVTEGIGFGRPNGQVATGRFVIYNGSYLNVVSTDLGFVVRNLKRNDIIKLRFSTHSNGSSRKIILTNAVSDDNLTSSDSNNPNDVILRVLSDGYVGIRGEEGMRYYTLKVNEETNYDIALEATGYATFSAYERFVVPSGLTAYRAVYNNATSSVSLSEITDGIIPTSTGVILKGTPNTPYTLTSTTSAVTTGDNDMKANVKEKVMTETETIDEVEYTNFILVPDGKGGVKFAKVSGGKLAANRAYLQLPTDDVKARELSISFDDGETTGISEIEKLRNVGNEKFFDLQGRLVAQPTKGLYIVNGKKYIVK